MNVTLEYIEIKANIFILTHIFRPNLGIVNYCLTEDAILGANEKKLEDVTKHEICHALVSSFFEHVKKFTLK